MNVQIDYDELNIELQSIQAGVGASECHGFMTGYFCSNNLIVHEHWQEMLFGSIEFDESTSECLKLLSALAEQTGNQILDEAEISFNPLLPDDETSISERTAALGEWCSGFISGLGVGGMGEKETTNPDCEEFVKDMVSLSRMETNVEDSEDAENDLFEIIEYVRVGVLMLHQEWHSQTEHQPSPRVLH